MVSQEELRTDRLSRARAGDRLAFEELLEPVLDPAFRLAMTLLNDRSAAEDAVQEGALKAWQKFGQFRSGADMRPWFLTIVANECRSARRSRWWRVARGEQFDPGVQPDPAELAASGRLDLVAALKRLPRRHLLALTLYYHLDLPIDEVARVLRCSPATARVRISRALRVLRPELGVEVNR